MALPPHIVRELLKPDGGNQATVSTEHAYRFCSRLTKMHYENFPVGSWLVGKELQPHIAAVYAFARLADDVADDLPLSAPERITILHSFEAQLTSPVPGHPVFTALAQTIQQKQLPYLPFRRLLQAFRMDCEFRQATDWSDLHHYCSLSANPVGEIVLRLFGEDTTETIACSDAICTALQLANFWQDLSVDIPRGRLYIPNALLEHYGFNTQDFMKRNFVAEEFSAKFHESLNAMAADMYSHTQDLFQRGSAIVGMLHSRRLRFEIALTLAGGMTILHNIRKKGLNIYSSRPSLGFSSAVRILLHTLSLYRHS